MLLEVLEICVGMFRAQSIYRSSANTFTRSAAKSLRQRLVKMPHRWYNMAGTALRETCAAQIFNRKERCGSYLQTVSGIYTSLYSKTMGNSNAVSTR